MDEQIPVRVKSFRQGNDMAHISKIVPAEGEQPRFAPGDRVRVGVRFPIGHYRVPHYIRGKTAVIERVIEPPAVNNEEEGFGRNAGSDGRHLFVWYLSVHRHAPAPELILSNVRSVEKRTLV